MSIPKPIEKPEKWESKLTKYQLRDASEFESMVLTGLNVLEQQNEWVINAVIQLSDRDLERAIKQEDLEARLKKLETVETGFRSKWSLIAWQAAFIAAAVEIVTHVRSWFFK